MKEGGVLKITTLLDNEYVHITFRDTGPRLSISVSIVEKHGGSLYVENNPDKGVTFTVRIPKEGDL